MAPTATKSNEKPLKRYGKISELKAQILKKTYEILKLEMFNLKPRSHALINTRFVNFTYMYNLHQMYFVTCECDCMYVNLICKCANIQPRVNIHQLRPDVNLLLRLCIFCIYVFYIDVFLHICIFGHMNAQQIYTRMQM